MNQSIINQFLTEGKRKELKFLEDYLKKHEYAYSVIADRADDINKHIDLYINSKGYDVKGAKKTNRTDVVADFDIHWIELRNVSGNKGWLFGQADFIVFELLAQWIIVSRKELIKALSDKVDFSKFVTTPDEFFKVYRRSGRRDAIVKVPSEFLMYINNVEFILKSEE